MRIPDEDDHGRPEAAGRHGCRKCRALWDRGLNLDRSRVPTEDLISNHSRSTESALSKGIYGDSKAQMTHQTAGQQIGRWPSNVILTKQAGNAIDGLSGELRPSRYFKEVG